MNLAMSFSKFLLINYSVPTDQLDDAQRQVLGLLTQIAEEESIELKQITRLLYKARDKFIEQVENDPSIFAEIAITSFKYGDLNGKDLESWTATLERFNILSSWNKDQWISVLKTYLIENPSVSVLAKPSLDYKVYEGQCIEDRKRSEYHNVKYGNWGLDELKNILEKAQKKINIPVPESLLAEFKSPNTSEIKFIETDMGSTGNSQVPGINLSSSIQKLIDQDKPDNFNLDLHFEHYPSYFVTVYLLMPTRDVDLDLLPLVDVFLKNLSSLPLKLDIEDTLDFESATQNISAGNAFWHHDNFKHYDNFGYYDNFRLHDTFRHHDTFASFGDTLTFRLQVRCDKYDLAVECLHNALTRTQFTEDRLRVVLENYMDNLIDKTKNRPFFVRSSMNSAILTNRSMREVTDIYETDEYYKALLLSLNDSEGVSALQEKLERARKSQVKPENIKVLVTGDITKLKNCVKTWAPFAKDLSKNVHPENPYTRDEGPSIFIFKTAFVSPVPESHYYFTSPHYFIVSKGPIDFLDKDIAAVSVCSQYFGDTSGPLRRAIWDGRLAFWVSMDYRIEKGLVKLGFQSQKLGETIQVCQQLFARIVSGEIPIEAHLLERIKNSIIYKAVLDGKDAERVAENNYLNCNLMGRERDYLKRYLNHVQNIDAGDMQKVLQKYFLALFRPDSSTVFAACGLPQTNFVKEELEKIGYKVQL